MNIVIGIKQHSCFFPTWVALLQFPLAFLDLCGHVLYFAEIKPYSAAVSVEGNNPKKLILISGYLSSSFCVMG